MNAKVAPKRKILNYRESEEISKTVTVNFSELGIFISMNELRRKTETWPKVKLRNTNFCAKFQSISYNRSKTQHYTIRFFYDFSKEILKLEKSKTNPFFDLKIRTCWKHNEL